MIENKTTIIASQQNIELLETFFDANGMNPGAELSEYRVIFDTSEDEDYCCVERYYRAISVNYREEDEHIGIILLNLAAKHHGLNNMLADYLIKVHAYPVVMKYAYTKPASAEEINNNFINNVVPRLPDVKSKHVRRNIPVV